MLDETLLWKVIQLITEIINFDRKKNLSTSKKTSSVDESSFSLILPTDDQKFHLALDNKKTGKPCYFKILELEVGNIVLSGNFLILKYNF